MPTRSPTTGSTNGPARGPGRPVSFNRNHVLDVAGTMLMNGGIEGLTMRRLASGAGTTLAAIYRHLGDKEGVLSAVLDRFSEDIPRTPLTGTPQDRMLAIGQGIYAVLVTRAWIVDILRRGGSTGTGALWFAEEYIAAAEELGAHPIDALNSYRALWNYVLGALLTRVEPEQTLELDTPLARKILAAAERDGLTRVTTYVGAPRGTSERLFRRGLIAVVAGLAAQCRGKQ
ncbi:TetR/AcrR family transcriptional regulator [Mycetocola tolaasinivorans]|uniref:TetR/AcrR family transcriptional regulator n=1 Tax=Mycetocola tolaasinivorans TaxID=76635 RepID=A0A3L7A3R6_9MICO|nr:TetR/AcrR family transcriptional regulator [Mycetocola tolaasinivorans]RLP74983.1 TetR/AcrR family transcriptional regulator [Mycetocola tolaasinivorans]